MYTMVSADNKAPQRQDIDRSKVATLSMDTDHSWSCHCQLPDWIVMLHYSTTSLVVC